jgi:hypothetical protein
VDRKWRGLCHDADMQQAIPLFVVASLCLILGVALLRLIRIGRRSGAQMIPLMQPTIYAFALAIVLSVVACSTIKKVPDAAKQAGVECLKENKDELFKLTLDAMGQAVRWLAAGLPVDWKSLVAQAEAQGTVVATCAVVETWHKIHTPDASKSTAEALVAAGDTSGRADIERLRARIGGGQWILSDGSKQ